jgi:RNA recognition motif-containing protein
MAEAVPTDETVRIGRRTYVGNLAWKTSWQDLKDKFRECGNVVYANVMKDDAGEFLLVRGFAART